MKQQTFRILLGSLCLIVLLGHALKVWPLHFVSTLDAYVYDLRLRLSMPDTLDAGVVIVDIDERSLAEVGRWPWRRDRLADMVRRLSDDYGAAVIGFDVVFAEPDESSGLAVLDGLANRQLRNEPGFRRALDELRPQLDYDRQFADALRGRPVVLGYYFSLSEASHALGALPPPLFAADAFPGHAVPVVSWLSYGGNLPILQEAAARGGHFNPMVDFDGITRRVPLLVEYAGAYYEALSLAVVRTLLGDATVTPGFPDQAGQLEWLEVSGKAGSLIIPVDEQGAALVPYRGYERSFPYVSAVDVLQGKADPAWFRGRIVLVGTTAPGLMDLRATPVNAVYPGVEVHANLIAGMLSGTMKQKPEYVLAIETLQLLLVGALLLFLLPRLSPARASLLTLVVLGLVLLTNVWLWSAANIVVPLAATLLVIALLYALHMSWGYFVESRSKRQFAELFGQYVPPELVDEMARDPERYSMDGRNAELTVLFADIRSFTSLSEGMAPKELANLMNDYFGAMTDIIGSRRGTLDKYIGDAIMAFWGAPVADAAHARHAVEAALAMQQAVAGLAEPFRARGWPPLRIGIGINTGTMTVGDMGSRVRKAYTVMGDAVNLASRLEGITKEYGVGIVVGEATRQQLPDMAFRELDRVRVKGKDDAVAIYEPLGAAGEISPAVRAELLLWQQVLRLYRAGDWDAAELQLYNLQRDAPDCRLYALYAERIVALRKNPPPGDWDGTFTFLNK